MKTHYCLTAVGAKGAQFTVYADGNIHDAMRALKAAAGVATSHGRGCSCGNPAQRHPGNQVVRDGELVST